MTTPSETRAGKLRDLAQRMKEHSAHSVVIDWAAEIEAIAAAEHATPSLIDAARMALKWAGPMGEAPVSARPEWFDKLTEALAAREPVEAGCACDGKMTDGRHWLSCPLSHPAPEQPGKGEAERSVRFHNALWKSLPESVRSHASMLTQVWKTADSTELAEACKAGVLALAAVATPQPSDPAEGDAVQCPCCGAPCALGEQFVSGLTGDEAGGEIVDTYTYLSTPQTAAVSVDDLVEQYRSGDRVEFTVDQFRHFLTAALDPQGSCTCPSGDGSLRWPCPQHPPEAS